MENNSQHNFTLHNLPIRDRTDQDPDYNEAAPPDRKRLKHLEENARTRLGERVKHILNNHFELEVSRQHNEILEIDKCISRVQQKLQILRYVANRSFFSSKSLQSIMPSASQTTMHPAVKNMLGKRPVKMADFINVSVGQTEEVSRNSANSPTIESLKIPRYIPPKLPDRIVAAPVRGELHCLKKKLIIGNVSRWIPVSERDDTASHKWMIYVRGPKEEPNVSSFVSRVIFFLHPSYAPHDTIHVESHPFHVTRRGWGEFPLRIQVHFQNPLCKPVNIIHNLKLDRSYTGIQTLGAETIVDVMVYDSKIISSSSSLFDETSHVTIKMDHEKRSEPEDEAAVKIGVSGENDALAMKSHNSHIFHNPQYIEENAFSDAHDAQHCQVSEKNNSIDTVYRDGKTKGECSSLELSSDTEIGERTDKENTCSNEATNPICESKIVIQDHDYFERENETLKTGSSSLEKDGINVEEFRGAFKSLTSASCITAAPLLPSSSTADTATNSVLVRCFNKNGTTFKLPLALLRNAVILQPYRVAKVGESLLRPPALKATQESPVSAIQSQPILGKVIASISRPHTYFKPDPNKLEKFSVEALFSNESKSYDAFFEKIFSLRWSNVKDCVRVLARDLCLINSKAEDPVYRSVRPYTSPSLEIFSSWNVGKRRSAEWTRAKRIRVALEKCSFASGENIWTTKTIMNWCRMQGYSPMCCWLKTSTGQQPFDHSAVLTQEMITLTKTELRSSYVASDDEEIIEVESLNDVVDTPSFSTQFPKASFLLNDVDPDLTTWIVDSIEKHGFKLGAELYENFLISFSRVLLSHVWRGITEDLLRRSLSESWLRTQGAIPDEISWIDTCRAISNRPQFDILTNAGMGVEESVHDTIKLEHST